MWLKSPAKSDKVGKFSGIPKKNPSPSSAFVDFSLSENYKVITKGN